MKVNNLILQLLILMLISSCKLKTAVDEELLEDFRDPFKLTTLKAVEGNVLNKQNISIQIENDTKAIKWCLSESQETLPTSNECLGGEGSENGWSNNSPTSYTLSSNDGIKKLNLWLMAASGNVRKEKISLSVLLDMTAPVVTLTSPSIDINSTNVTSYNFAGACTGQDKVHIELNSNSYQANCENNLWNINLNLTSLAQGNISAKIFQTDEAKNKSVEINRSILKDTNLPTISITNVNGSYVNNANQSAYTLSGTCSDDGNISLTGGIVDSISCSGGNFSKSFNLTGLAQGAIIVNFQTTDSAGNSSVLSSLNLVKDTVIPTFSFGAPTNGAYINSLNQNSFTVSGSCSETDEIVFSGDFSGSVNCSSNTYSRNFNLSGLTDGAITLTGKIRDSAGNESSAITYTLNKDVVAPIFTQTAFTSGTLVNTNNIVLGGACESGQTINISGDQTGTVTCTSSAWTLTVDDKTSDGTYNYTLSQTDTAGNKSSDVSLNWTRDTIAPSLTSINVNSGGTLTANNNTLVDINGSSSGAMIEAFCLKYNSPANPSSGDPCWTTLDSIGQTKTHTFSLSQYPFQIGAILANYDVRVWLKDEVGNISTIANTVGTDLYTIAYQPDPPPSIFNVQATASDSPNNPLQSVDTTVLTGSDVYIKWNATDNNALPAGSVKLYYSSDDVNFTQIVTGLNNGVNGSCTLGTSTGCYKWTAASPLSSYYKIKVVVTDSSVSSVFSVSNALNTGSVKFLAGNTSLGIGGSANSAILLGEGESTFNDSVDPHSVVVTKTGVVFYKYKNKGLMFVSPENGLLKTLIPDTGAITGNGGDVANSTAKSIRRILLDYSGNLIIWDDNQVRKLDLSTTPWTITKLFGGGADTADGALGVNANLFSISSHSMFLAMPNGRLYYERGDDIWYYDPTDLKVKKYITLGGTGISSMSGGYANYDNTNCNMKNMGVAFDKATSQITKIMRKGYATTSPTCGARSSGGYDGLNANYDLASGLATAPHPPTTSWSSTKFTGMDGKIYVLVQGRKTLTQYDPATNTFNTVLGSTANGRCTDGTPALSCNAIIMSAFVNEFGKIYFYDMGVIRTVDSEGKVQTIAGQPRNFGVGYKPTSARFSKIAVFDMVDDEVFVKNKLENQIIKFSLNGGNVEHIAGSGVLGSASIEADAKTSALRNCNWSMPCAFKYDKVNQRLYHYNNYGRLNYVDLASGKWKEESGFTIQNTYSRISYLGADNSQKLFVYAVNHNGSAGGISSYQEVDPTVPSATRVYGITTKLSNGSISAELCNGVDPKTCALRETQGEDVQTQAKYKADSSNWLIANRNLKKINTIEPDGSATSLFTTTQKSIRTFEYRKVGADDIIYYCATDGYLYKRNATAGTETQYSFPTPSMKCHGHSVQYNSAKDELVFIYEQNGLFGIASYKNP